MRKQRKLSIVASVARYVFSRNFAREAVVFHSRITFGLYRRHNGDQLPYFFSRIVELDQLLVDGIPLDKTPQFARVSEVLDGSAPLTPGSDHLGRDVARTAHLVAERRAGRDNFVLCLTRDASGKLNIEDGATRACLLFLTGEQRVRAVITPWK